MGLQALVYAGTVGQSIWRSCDGGDTWSRASGGALYMECDVRALVAHPHTGEILYAGTDEGFYRTNDGGDKWTHLSSPMDQKQIWSLAIHPENPDIIFAGTRPSGLYRTTDAGASWTQLHAGIETHCTPIVHTRVTTILTDPAERQTIFAGVEIDGVYRSTDGGETWTSHKKGLNSLDVHGLAIIRSNPKTIIATTNAGICRSMDNGETWSDLNVEETFPWGYCRGVITRHDDSGTLIIGNGNGPPGDCGSIQISDDLGESWREGPLPCRPNSTIWHFASCRRDPELIFACTVSGQIYRSEDGGSTWKKLDREFGEIRTMLAV
ncbi:MAG: YCF48-related protein [Gemmatimonadota bacterium]|nr:YCF48-related protein [Gemmatimonadota bacterium]